MKNVILTVVSLIGAAFAEIFGGWTGGLTTLVCFMAMDYISGIMAAGLFHNSPKSSDGRLESHAGFKGLCKKGMILLFVLISYRLDLMTNSNYIRDTLAIGFSINELISWLENMKLMGVDIPAYVFKIVEFVKNKVLNGKG